MTAPTREQVRQWAKEGMEVSTGGGLVLVALSDLQAFAALAYTEGQDTEREACEKICEIEAKKWPCPSHGNAAATICLTAIQARKNNKCP